MWRWLHSLPRAVRQQCPGPGASAGIHVEDRCESDCKKDSRRYVEKAKENPKWTQCRTTGEHKKDHDEKSQQTVPPEFWRLVHGPYSTCDAIGLGGVLAAGFHFHNCHFQYIKEKYRNPDLCTKCCIRPRFPIVHALPGLGPQSVRETPPQKPRQKHGDQKKPVGLRQRHNIQSYTPIVKSLWINEDDEIANEKAESKPTEAEKPIPKVDAAQKVETLESVFADFSDVCNKYTAIGKSIMGLQAAEDGNNKLAADLWQEACELGNTKAKFNLAVCYEHGKGVQKDQKEAIRLYKMAAEDLYPKAMYNLGLLYLEGSFYTPRDISRGLDLVTTAADFSLPEAQRYLGVYYTEERTENPEKAIKYLTMAANQNDSESQYALALCYQYGYGVPENLCKAADLYSKAANNGHPDALYTLAVFHRDGLGGLPQDLHSAERLTQRAAQLGSHEAQLELLLRSPENLKADKKSNAQKRKGNKTSKQSAHGSYLTLPSLTDLVQDSISSSHKPSDTESLFDKIKPLIPELLLSESMVVTRATESTPSVNDNGYSKQKAVHKTGSKKTAPKISQSRSGSELNNGYKFYLENCADDLSEVSADSLECAVESCSTLHRRHNTMPDLSIVMCP